MQSVLVEILNQYQTGGSVPPRQMSNAKSGMTVTPDSIRMAATMVATHTDYYGLSFYPEIFCQGNHAGRRKGMTIGTSLSPGDLSSGDFSMGTVFFVFFHPQWLNLKNSENFHGAISKSGNVW